MAWEGKIVTGSRTWLFHLHYITNLEGLSGCETSEFFFFFLPYAFYTQFQQVYLRTTLPNYNKAVSFIGIYELTGHTHKFREKLCVTTQRFVLSYREGSNDCCLVWKSHKIPASVCWVEQSVMQTHTSGYCCTTQSLLYSQHYSPPLQTNARLEVKPTTKWIHCSSLTILGKMVTTTQTVERLRFESSSLNSLKFWGRSVLLYFSAHRGEHPRKNNSSLRSCEHLL